MSVIVFDREKKEREVPVFNSVELRVFLFRGREKTREPNGKRTWEKCVAVQHSTISPLPCTAHSNKCSLYVQTHTHIRI